MVKSFVDAGEYSSIVQRVNALSADSTPLWGKMNVAQMFAHCAEVQEVLNGTKKLQGTPFIFRFVKGLIKKAVVNRVPYKKKSGTHPQYVTSTNEYEFEEAQERLLAALAMNNSFSKEEAESIEHALFGKLSVEERGVASWKHVDHHLRQFGV